MLPPKPSRRVLISAGMAVILPVAMLLFRVRLYVQPGLLLGWNSDTAIYGLIARAMVEEERPHWLFWGQDYLGTLTSLWTLVVSPLTGGVGPLALRVGAVLQVALGLYLFWLVMRRAWGWRAATLAVVWLIAGPRWFFEMTYAPLSAEQMFFAGAVLLWWADRTSLRESRHWFVFGIFAGAGWWAHRGSLFAAVAAIVVVVWADERLRDWRRVVSTVAVAAAGVGIGCVPLIAGRARIDQRLYEPVVAQFDPSRLFERVVETLTVDLWEFIGSGPGGVGVAFSLVMFVGFAVGCLQKDHNRAAWMLYGVLIVSALFWMFSPQAYSGATRYLILALPVAYGVVARGIEMMLRRTWPAVVAAALSAPLVTAHLSYGRAQDIASIVAGERENHYVWHSCDPRKALTTIARQRYEVCYADFWVAYKLEWLSESGVKFIPYLSVDRTQRRSERLAVTPGRRCFVDRDCSVRELDAAEVKVRNDRAFQGRIPVRR